MAHEPWSDQALHSLYKRMTPEHNGLGVLYLFEPHRHKEDIDAIFRMVSLYPDHMWCARDRYKYKKACEAQNRQNRMGNE